MRKVYNKETPEINGIFLHKGPEGAFGGDSHPAVERTGSSFGSRLPNGEIVQQRRTYDRTITAES